MNGMTNNMKLTYIAGILVAIAMILGSYSQMHKLPYEAQTSVPLPYNPSEYAY